MKKWPVLIASVSAACLGLTLPASAQETGKPETSAPKTAAKPESADKLPVYKEGQVISTEPPVDAASEVQGAAQRNVRDNVLGLPDLQALGQVGDTANSDAWRAYVRKDYVKARLLAARAGANGDKSAQLLMGILLDHGLGGDADPSNAVNWYKKSANLGQEEAWLALTGMALANRGGLSASDARGFLHQAADLGNVDAMVSLGKAYASGMGGPIDDVQARKWYENAVSQGSNKARVKLADLKLANGDTDAALKLYRTAMFGGSAEAAWKAGVLLADPTMKQHDRALAGQYLQTAADAGLPAAMTDYGTWFATSVPPLDAQAARWFRKAAKADNAEGQYLFAVALAKGQGVMQDRAEAYEWALRAHAHDPGNQDYENLELALEKGMPPNERDLVFARSKMPLAISHVSAADADKAAAAEARQVEAEKQQEAQAKQAEKAARATEDAPPPAGTPQ